MKRFFSWLFDPNPLEEELKQLQIRLAEETNPAMREALLITIRDIEIELYSRYRK